MTDKMSNEKEIIICAQSGNPSAVETLLERYKDMVRIKSGTYKALGFGDDDMLQEGMIGLYRAVLSYRTDSPASFKTYAERCVNNRMLSTVTMAARKKYLPLNSSVSLDEALHFDGSENEANGDVPKTLADTIPANDDSDPESCLYIEELYEFFFGSESRLSAAEKDVLKLMLEDYDYREIAEKLNIKYKSVDNAVQRIRKKLSCLKG